MFMSYNPISESLLEALLAPFEPGQLYWQKLEEVADMARWQVVLRRDALFERLENVLALEWGFRLEVVSPLPPVVVAHLELGSSQRSGIGEGLSLVEAQVAALSQAALAYGIAHDELSQPHQWHNLDWKALQGKTTREIPQETPRVEHSEPMGHTEAEVGTPLEPSTPAPLPTPPTPPLEPEKPKHQKAIDDLVDELREMGLGLESAKIMREFKGYGETLDESRKLYSMLKAVKKGYS
jgi:hypothetical protein